MKVAFKLQTFTDLLPVCLAHTSAGVYEMYSGSTLCPCGWLFSYWWKLVFGLWSAVCLGL